MTPQRPQRGVGGGIEQVHRAGQSVCGRTRFGAGGLVVGSCERQPGTGRSLADGVQFGESADIADERLVLAGCRCNPVDLGERELQPVGLLGHLAGPVGAVEQIPPGGEPLVAQFPVALQCGADAGEAVQRGALLVRAHQAELIVLPVQGEQTIGESRQ